MSESYNIFGGNSLGVGVSRSASKVAKFVEIVKDNTKRLRETVLKGSKFELSYMLFENLETDTRSVTPCPVLAIILHTKEYTCTLCFLLSDSNVNELDQRKIHLKEAEGVIPIISNRFTSEVHDKFMEANLSPRISRSVTHSKARVFFAQSIVIYHTMEITEEFVREQHGRAVNRLSSFLGHRIVGDKADLTVGDISKHKGSSLNLNITMGEEYPVDSAGIPLANSVKLEVTVSKKRNSDRDNRRNSRSFETLNRPRNEVFIGSVNARASVIYTGGTPRDGYRSRRSSNPPELHHAFSPQLILENFDMGTESSFGKFMLMLINFTVLHDGALVRKMFANSPIGALNLACNLNDEEHPVAIDSDEIKDNFEEYYEKFFTATPLLSLVVRPGTWEYEYTKLFADASGGDREAGSALRELISTFCGKAPESININDLVGSTMEEYPVGTHTLNNNKNSQGLELRSASEFDVLWLMHHHPGDAPMHKAWVDSQNTRDIDEGYARKISVIQTATKRRFDMLDHRFMVTFTPNLIDLLKETYNSIGIRKDDNLSSFDSYDSGNWGRHMHASFSSRGRRGGWDDLDRNYDRRRDERRRDNRYDRYNDRYDDRDDYSYNRR